MPKETEKGTGSEPIFLRLPEELRKHVEHKTEKANRERKQNLQKPINAQDTIREIIRQDAVKSG